jgi:hypothetical protein
MFLGRWALYPDEFEEIAHMRPVGHSKALRSQVAAVDSMLSPPTPKSALATKSHPLQTQRPNR